MIIIRTKETTDFTDFTEKFGHEYPWHKLARIFTDLFIGHKGTKLVLSKAEGTLRKLR